MNVVKWRGIDFEAAGYWIGVRNQDAFGNWEVTPVTQNRRDANAEIVGVSRSPRPIVCQFGYGPGILTNEQSLHEFMAMIAPLRSKTGTLVMKLNDDAVTEWTCEAMIVSAGMVVDGDVNVYQITWLTGDPLWHESTATTAAGVLAPISITNPTFETDASNWTKGSDPANITSAFSRDAGVYYDAAGSGKVVVSANTGAGGAWYVENDTHFACTEGSIVQIKGATRSSVGYLSSTGISALPVVRWYDASNVYISENPVDSIFLPGDIMAANTWFEWTTLAYAAPEDTAYCKIGVQIAASAGATGTVYFDAFEFLTPPSGAVTPFDIEGHAPTNLTLTVTPSGNFPQSILARQFSLTNDGDDLIENLPLMVLLGDNAGSSISGTHWALLSEGKVVPCLISDYDNAYSFMFMVIERLAPGQSIDYTLLVSDQTIMPSTTFTIDNEPVIDLGYVYCTASGGGHTASVTNTTGLGSETDRWDEGIIVVITGARAGQMQRVSASTSTSVSHGSLSGALSNGDLFVLIMSHNGILGSADWVYAVRQTSRASDPKRGLWHTYPYPSSKPGSYDYKHPGSWFPFRYWVNNDVVGQAPFFKDSVTGHYFNGLDADRRWVGGGSLDYQGYDGVSIVMPCPITGLKFRFALKNPNSMNTAIVASRQRGGSAEMTHEYENSSATTSLTTQSERTLSLTADTKQLFLGLVPTNGAEIGETWAGDEGKASAANSTTLTDSSKEWITNQFAGGTITITDGTNANQTATIVSNTGSVITVGSWPGGTPDTTSSYRIKNRPWVSTVRLAEEFRMTWDPSTIGISAVSAETEAYVLYRDIWIDADNDGIVDQVISINPDVTGRYIFLLANESLVIDGATMRAWVADSSTGAEIRPVPPQAYNVYDVESDGTLRMATDWLWLNPGTHAVKLADNEIGVGCTIDAEWIEAVHG